MQGLSVATRGLYQATVGIVAVADAIGFVITVPCAADELAKGAGQSHYDINKIGDNQTKCLFFNLNPLII